MKKEMDQRDQQRQAIDAETEGTGRLRAGVDAAKDGLERTKDGVEDAAWLARERVLWPTEDRLGRLADAVAREKGLGGLGAIGGRVGGLDRRARVGIFGGGAVALGAIVAAVIVATSGGGSGSAPATTEALVVKQAPAPVVKAAPAVAPKPKKVAPAKPTGPTLHGAAPDFSPAQDVHSGVGGGKAVGKEAVSGETGGVAAERGRDRSEAAARGAGDTPASTAKIGSTPEATASATAEAETLSNANATGAVKGAGAGAETALTGPPAPKAAKRVARHFAEAFVVYETGGIDAKVRSNFRHTTTKQLAHALLRRPPRQPAAVEVPQAKVVTVVAGPSKGSVYEVSVSLLRVGVTSELRLAMEQGPGKKWQVTNVLG
jgi:hypothetical protein